LTLPLRVKVAFTFQVPTPGVAAIVSFQTRPSSKVTRWFSQMVWVIGRLFHKKKQGKNCVKKPGTYWSALVTAHLQ
jgi:hypothetical protein